MLKSNHFTEILTKNKENDTLDTRLAGGTGGKAGDSEILLTGVTGMVTVLISLGVTAFNSSSSIWVGGGGGGGLEVVVMTEDTGRS